MQINKQKKSFFKIAAIVLLVTMTYLGGTPTEAQSYTTKGQVLIAKTASVLDSVESFFSSIFGHKTQTTATPIAVVSPTPTYTPPEKKTYSTYTPPPVATEPIKRSVTTSSSYSAPVVKTVTNTVYVPVSSTQQAAPVQTSGVTEAELEARLQTFAASLPQPVNTTCYLSNAGGEASFYGGVSQNQVTNLQNQITTIQNNSTSTGGTVSQATIRSDFSATSPLAYNSSTGVFGTASGYSIPLTASSTNWNSFYDTPSTRITAGSHLCWNGNTLNVFGVSGGGGLINNATGCNAIALGTDSTAGGCNADSYGYQNTAPGNYSSALGVYNCASGQTASALGAYNHATGQAASASGYDNNACGCFSSAFGTGNTASDNFSSVFGFRNTASGYYSTAIGACNTANNSSLVLGDHNTADGRSVILGSFSCACDNSSAIGLFNTALGDNSSAIGRSNTASGCYSSAFGSSQLGGSNTASGSYSSAFGLDNDASGCYSSAFGACNSASGYCSSAFGYRNTASGNCSSALGACNTASGESSAFGYQNNALGICSTAVGIGNSVSSSFGPSAFGINNTASASYSSALGACNIACGSCSSAFGFSNTASGFYSSALGYNNTASGNCSSAFGTCLNNSTGCSAQFGGIYSGTPGYLTISPSGANFCMGGTIMQNGGAPSFASDRALKENFTDVDKQSILDKINALPMQQWDYIAQGPSVPHIAPIAQDFYAAFGLNNSTTSISAIDPAGIALVGIQALSERLDLLEGSSTFASMTIPYTSLTSTSSQSVFSTLESFGAEVVDGVAYLKNVFIEKLGVNDLNVNNTLTLKKGFQMQSSNGVIYCVTIDDSGNFVKTSGTCDDIASTPHETVSPTLDTSSTLTDATSTSTPDMSSTSSETMITPPAPTASSTPIVNEGTSTATSSGN